MVVRLFVPVVVAVVVVGVLLVFELLLLLPAVAVAVVVVVLPPLIPKLLAPVVDGCGCCLAVGKNQERRLLTVDVGPLPAGSGDVGRGEPIAPPSMGSSV